MMVSMKKRKDKEKEMGNRWREIWTGRDAVWTLDEGITDEFSVYKELKKLDGFDVNVRDKDAYYKSFYNSAICMWEQFRKEEKITNAYEVGCGSGANLYLLKNRGIKVGGIDYSEKLLNVAYKILGEKSQIIKGEAIDIWPDEKWDIVFSDSVFAYFPDEEYGSVVLEKMYDKAEKMVVLMEIFDKELEEDCISHRKKMIDDYDNKYQGLEKVFYPKDMFIKFAEKNHCEVKFTKVENEYYWNSKYLFNCILKKP